MDRDRLIKQLKRHEGFMLKPYYCSAHKLTIGIGHNIDALWFTPKQRIAIFGRENILKEEAIDILNRDGITEEEAYMLLNDEVDKNIIQAKANIPFFDSLSDQRQNVILNMIFNMGMNGVLAFKNTLNLIKEGKYSEAADAMLQSKWASQVGRRAKELSQQMRNNEFV